MLMNISEQKTLLLSCPVYKDPFAHIAVKRKVPIIFARAVWSDAHALAALQRELSSTRAQLDRALSRAADREELAAQLVQARADIHRIELEKEGTPPIPSEIVTAINPC